MFIKVYELYGKWAIGLFDHVLLISIRDFIGPDNLNIL